ncbi:nuclear GTPase SLIP-GC-like [Mercenaria mercenaria]|uniref:nuclear GTPase SLIP-GC-like n=1 Tax=Mercenaria mercenaria TaxID=6596 RepID=UPI00234E6543|nr:nuclear GTPase SLIP-GC-like [Mercenaria mercenaria]
MFGVINGHLVTLQRDMQQTYQEVRNLREEIRRVAERDDNEAILSVYTMQGVVRVCLRTENPAALAIVMNHILSMSPQQAASSNPVGEKVANISQDIRSLGGEVVSLQEGSVIFVINCASLTALMYVIDYFYSPKIRCRLDDIVKELQKKTGQDVELVADILPKSLEEILKKIKEGDNSDTKKEETKNKTSPTMSKVKALLLKRRKSQSGLPLSPELGQQTFDRKRKRDLSESQKLLISIDNHANRCREVIMELQDMFNNKPENIRQYPHVKAWIKELADIEKKLEFKPMVIAVIGNTGEGKSSLMNALLDKRDVLPTSGMKACTATVVEVVNNTTDLYEAEIEFLKEKEWFDELRKLCKDLTDENGVVTKTPDRNSGIYNSYCKMVALYGEIDKFDVLSKKTELTKWLGQIKPIRATNLDDFKKEVESHVEVQEPGTDHCFWPIVKRVRLKLPDCDVCSSGAVLVDLPGRGDSDEARNAIAKSHLGKCEHIWIVSSIHRAINDRTAQDLLGEQLRSQFYMNGQLGAVSFICTKTDMVNAKECHR